MGSFPSYTQKTGVKNIPTRSKLPTMNWLSGKKAPRNANTVIRAGVANKISNNAEDEPANKRRND